MHLHREKFYWTRPQIPKTENQILLEQENVAHEPFCVHRFMLQRLRSVQSRIAV